MEMENSTGLFADCVAKVRLFKELFQILGILKGLEDGFKGFRNFGKFKCPEGLTHPWVFENHKSQKIVLVSANLIIFFIL